MRNPKLNPRISEFQRGKTFGQKEEDSVVVSNPVSITKRMEAVDEN